MNYWIFSIIIFLTGYALGKGVALTRTASISMKTVIIAQFQSLVMSLKSVEHFATLRVWHDQTAAGLDQVIETLKEQIEKTEEMTSVQKDELLRFFDKKYTEELKTIWNIAEENQEKWKEDTAALIKDSMYPYGKIVEWNSWPEAMSYWRD